MNGGSFYFHTRCRMCDSSALQRVLTLTPTPPGNDFLRPEEIGRPEPVYPLELYFCAVCHHLQLGHVVDPKILYQKDYTYVSATSSKFVGHLRDYAARTVSKYALAPGSRVLDIGSNDGTCLRFFAEAGMRVLGIDPATEIARRATESGVETICEFWSSALAARVREAYGPAALVTSHNACAHIDDLQDVCLGVAQVLDDDGLFVLEVGYLLDVFQNTWFDTIYHEHLDYHTVDPFRALFARVGLELLSVERISPQGGSIRVTAQRLAGPRRADGSAQVLVDLEHEAGLNRPETFVDFGRRIDAVGAQLRSLVLALRVQGKSIAGFGAPTKATTLLSHFGIGRADLDFIVDDNPLKQGLLSPTTHIPVLAPSALYSRRPDYVLILAWNFAEPIMATHTRYAREGGQFILPMPEARIVGRPGE